MMNVQKQKGVALLTILVMVALATILAATILKHQTYTAEQTAYMLRQNQSTLYAQSAELFLSELLLQDEKNAGEVDHLQETWAMPLPAFPVEDGYVLGQLFDESGKFNLNNLVKDDGTVDEVSQRFFKKLLLKVGLAPDLVEAVIDWQDPDNEVVGAMGAESDFYEGLSPPYTAANRKFFSIDELKQVRGFSGENFDKISPYVSALPVKTQININTSPAVVLASVDESIDVKQVESEIQAQRVKLIFFKQVDDLWKLNTFSAVEGANRTEAESLFAVKSSFFKAKIEVMLSGRKRQFQSDLMRDSHHVLVYARSLKPYLSGTVKP